MRLNIEVADTELLVELYKILEIVNEELGPTKLFWQKPTMLIAHLESDNKVADLQTCCSRLKKVKDVKAVYILI